MDERDLLEDDQQNKSFFSYERIEDIDNNELLVNFEEETEDDANSCEQHEDHMASNCNKIINCSLTPRIGMEFPDNVTVYEFYKRYALRQGFATRIFSSQRRKNGDDFYRRMFVCNKEGVRSVDKREGGREIKKRRCETIENCKAHMIVQACDEPLVRTTIDEYYKCGVGPSKISQLTNSTSHSSVKITPQQVTDHLKINRKSNICRECTVVLQKFFERQAQDSQFYYAIEVDENQVCRNQYDNVVTKHRDTEEKEDFFCITTKLNFIELSPLEAQAGQALDTEVTLQHLGSTGQSSQASTIMSNVTIRDPSKFKTKGRPKKATRIPSGIHVAQSQTTTKKHTCKTCGETGHNARTYHPD
ncbi:hypothetical protein POM88_021054 [Heracleum sosnowskyi]|uniref:FAR1 domain-containing protein n=1 Tax=Heracleum sosnowskyi TaxID=360622 RepID=A0AAD8ICN3_9APIA|nr:hypothetical protein POM88_021054 [Heracleum sosnowskyi]